jgi:hypothetical protein
MTDPNIYALLELNVCVVPPDVGDVTLYQPFSTEAAINTANWVYDNAHNYYLSFVNIDCALFQMLDENINGHFKVSNIPISWNEIPL